MAPPPPSLPMLSSLLRPVLTIPQDPAEASQLSHLLLQRDFWRNFLEKFVHNPPSLGTLWGASLTGARRGAQKIYIQEATQILHKMPITEGLPGP